MALIFFVMVFVVGALFLTGVLYSSAQPSGSEKVNGDVEDSSNE